MTQLAWCTHPTPIGDLELAATTKGLVLVAFGAAEAERKLHQMPAGLDADDLNAAEAHLAQARRELDEYFARDRHEFEVPLDRTGATGFRAHAQLMLSRIPYGETVSYGELAEMSGRPRAARAAGSACANNPLPVVTPCHRVVRSDGSLGEYGGKPAAKRFLLDLEGYVLPR